MSAITFKIGRIQLLSKRNIFSFIILLSLGISTACASSGVSTPPLIFNETIVLDKQADTFPMVREIQIQGSQREIGRKMAEIAKTRYEVTLAKNLSPDYGKARYA